jgi:hypothetical protein
MSMNYVNSVPGQPSHESFGHIHCGSEEQASEKKDTRHAPALASINTVRPHHHSNHKENNTHEYHCRPYNLHDVLLLFALLPALYRLSPVTLTMTSLGRNRYLLTLRWHEHRHAANCPPAVPVTRFWP